MQNEIQQYNICLIEELDEKLDKTIESAQNQINIMKSKNRNIFVRLKDFLFDHEYEKAEQKLNEYCGIINEIDFKIVMILSNMGDTKPYYKWSRRISNFVEILSSSKVIQ